MFSLPLLWSIAGLLSTLLAIYYGVRVKCEARGARRVKCEGECEAARDWSAINRFLAVYPPFSMHGNDSIDHGNTALRPPACDLRARRDERHSKHAAHRGAAYVISRTADDVRPTGSEREWPFNWKHCWRLIDFDWQVVDNGKILLGINQEAHNSICRLQELMQLCVNGIMLW